MENIVKKNYCEKCQYQAQNDAHFIRHNKTKSHLNADILIEYHGIEWWNQRRKNRTEGKRATRVDDRRLKKKDQETA